MLHEQIDDVLDEVGDVRAAMPEGSLQRELMNDVYRTLTLAQSLIHAVNVVQLNRLMNGDR